MFVEGIEYCNAAIWVNSGILNVLGVVKCLTTLQKPAMVILDQPACSMSVWVCALRMMM